jgi:putative hemolysin
MSHTIELDPAFALPSTPFTTPVVRFAERLLGYDALNRLHRTLVGEPSADVVRRALDALGVGVEVDGRDRARLPAQGGAIVVANLPNGLLDGLVLARVLLEIRSDVKLLVARRERRLPELGGLLLELDAKNADRTRNVRVLCEALRHVARGGMLVLYPALDAVHLPQNAATHDAPWATFAATLARRARVPVHPVYLPPARSSFLRAQLLRHPRLRQFFEPVSLLARRGQVLRPRVGHAIAVDTLTRFTSDRELTDFFRLRTGLLGRGVRTVGAPTSTAMRALEPIAEPIAGEVLAREIDALLAQDPATRIATGGGLEAILAPAAAIPNVLLEIGRLREITFRAVDEGSGRARDLDRHDAYYRHLFLYDRAAQRIVGGYRLGLTDELLARGGASALYTASLFDFDSEFLAHVTPGIELGRSFIVADYQRSYAPLDLLWRGIGAFVAQNPRYTRVFGPVSISAGYSGISRELIVEHIERNQYDSALARAVRPRTPLRRSGRGLGGGLTDAMIADTGEVSRWITELEPDAKAMPVLVREYLKLGGMFVGFNLDAGFGDCLDGLVVVDLDRMPEKYRRRYLRPG